MADVNLSINGKPYSISCDAGQEKRVTELGRYVDSRLREISKAGAASTETHLLVLTALMLADEITELRNNITQIGEQVAVAGEIEREEQIIIQAIDSLADRIDLIADRIQKA
jgi:cell division protein ZapA